MGTSIYILDNQTGNERGYVGINFSHSESVANVLMIAYIRHTINARLMEGIPEQYRSSVDIENSFIHLSFEHTVMDVVDMSKDKDKVLTMRFIHTLTGSSEDGNFNVEEVPIIYKELKALEKMMANIPEEFYYSYVMTAPRLADAFGDYDPKETQEAVMTVYHNLMTAMNKPSIKVKVD